MQNPEIIDARGADLKKPARLESSETFRQAFETWLRNKLHPQLMVDPLDAPKGNGFANDTFLARIRMPDSRVLRYVVRREPLKTPIFLGLDLSIQYKVMQALHAAGILVPKLVFVEDDPEPLGARFCVMEQIDGLIAPDSPPYTIPNSSWVAQAAPATLEALWWNGLRGLLTVHQLDWESAGLAWMRRETPGGRQLERDLDYYEGLFRTACTPYYSELIDDAFTWARSHLPDEPHVSVNWGDARLGNFIFNGVDCVGLLDWEQAGLGAPEKDLAWWLVNDRFFHQGLDVPRPAGWPSHEETLSQYAKWLGRPLQAMPFYIVMASLTQLILFVRLISLGLMPAASPGEEHPAAKLLHASLADARSR